MRHLVKDYLSFDTLPIFILLIIDMHVFCLCTLNFTSLSTMNNIKYFLCCITFYLSIDNLIFPNFTYDRPIFCNRYVIILYKEWNLFFVVKIIINCVLNLIANSLVSWHGITHHLIWNNYLIVVVYLPYLSVSF